MYIYIHAALYTVSGGKISKPYLSKLILALSGSLRVDFLMLDKSENLFAVKESSQDCRTCTCKRMYEGLAVIVSCLQITCNFKIQNDSNILDRTYAVR